MNPIQFGTRKQYCSIVIFDINIVIDMVTVIVVVLVGRMMLLFVPNVVSQQRVHQIVVGVVVFPSFVF